MIERNGENDIGMILEQRIDPSERTYFIERTGVVIRWMLILAGTIIQIIEPVIPMQYFYIALPIAIVYNLGVRFLLEKKALSPLRSVLRFDRERQTSEFSYLP